MAEVKALRSPSGSHSSHVPIDPEFEITRPHGAGRLYSYFIDHKYRQMTSRLPISLTGASILDVCCGSGMISEMYARAGARVTGVDLDTDAIERAKVRAKRFGFSGDFRTANACDLPFPDRSFDIVSVHDGLHHIPDPHKAIREMSRVAKRAIVITEPARSFLTEVSIRLGTSLRYEGEDFVYRFTKRELAQYLHEEGFSVVGPRRYLMYYPHKPGFVFRLLGLPGIFAVAKVGFAVVNAVLGGVGNKIVVVGGREGTKD